MESKAILDFDMVIGVISFLVDKENIPGNRGLLDEDNPKRDVLTFFIVHFETLLNGNSDFKNRFPHSSNPNETMRKYMDIREVGHYLNELQCATMACSENKELTAVLSEAMVLMLKHVESLIDEYGETYMEPSN